jgi:hypothetical protein
VTKTPFEEFMEAIGHGAQYFVTTISASMLADRAELVKALWVQAVVNAPPGALEGADGHVLSVFDPIHEDGTIDYEKITYGDKSVIEAEGIVVCHLIG